MPLLVVRHAHAGRRSAYRGDDRDRPLSPRGVARARDLVPLLSGYRPQRILSSPFVRCFATVEPLAEALGLAVESVDELAEGHGADGVRLMTTMAGESAVLCTHGDVALEMLEELVPDPKSPQGRSLRLQKGEVWVVQSTGSSPIVVQHLRRLTRSGQRPAEGG
jgi:phosphohistidine phosphatase SixA